jgi:hypothetical protein
MSCNRTTVIEKSWVNDWTGETESEWQSVSACNFVDLTLHSYMCTTCGERMWYSARGKIAEQSGRDVHDVSYDEVDRHEK